MITEAQIARIADAAAGDARLAIGILRAAAGQADQRNADRITGAILEDAASAAKVELKQK